MSLNYHGIQKACYTIAINEQQRELLVKVLSEHAFQQPSTSEEGNEAALVADMLGNMATDGVLNDFTG